MKIIVGLGNPGRKYQGTRHNVGYMTVDLLSRRHHIPIRARALRAHIGQGIIAGQEVVLAKPLTFMNLSGQAVSALVRKYQVTPADLIVISDDVNLPLGRLRIRASGSAGGHGGLKSIINELGTEDFPRIRIGIGMPAGDMVDYVLSKFSRSEMPIIREVISRAADAVETILEQGIEQAMNRFNAPSL
ncbi:MAG: aminoacyl-tRNA hydrolase [Armatimonadota bacterium]|nr:aminoacyl-tRNA hydrolase [Armatimonadota bacterium]